MIWNFGNDCAQLCVAVAEHDTQAISFSRRQCNYFTTIALPSPENIARVSPYLNTHQTMILWSLKSWNVFVTVNRILVWPGRIDWRARQSSGLYQDNPLEMPVGLAELGILQSVYNEQRSVMLRRTSPRKYFDICSSFQTLGWRDL